ncbi:hypothetical protein AB4Y63_02680 [Leifsonia sp. YAF41]|uniref:hypothetical protein n=1 Tax=Leifsonia sp. YAF41 TaxID=3233086 RepID=UPI003F964B7E
MSSPSILLIALFWLIVAALGFWVSWLVIRSAVLSALRTFARSSQADRPADAERGKT